MLEDEGIKERCEKTLHVFDVYDHEEKHPTGWTAANETSKNNFIACGRGNNRMPIRRCLYLDRCECVCAAPNIV